MLAREIYNYFYNVTQDAVNEVVSLEACSPITGFQCSEQCDSDGKKSKDGKEFNLNFGTLLLLTSP